MYMYMYLTHYNCIGKVLITFMVSLNVCILAAFDGMHVLLLL